MSDDVCGLTDFSGTVRLFPLPNLVLFPHVMQPLHIFEPRYRQMTADALAGDRLLALVLLCPGWEANYQGRPAVHPVACLGRIVAHQRMDDGRFNILLRGLRRVRLGHETDAGKLYRVARADLLADDAGPAKETTRRLRRHLARLVPRCFPAQPGVLEQFRRFLRSELPLGALGDIIAFALPLEPAIKQELLEELNVAERIKRLLACLEAAGPTKAEQSPERGFPPEFSRN